MESIYIEIILYVAIDSHIVPSFIKDSFSLIFQINKLNCKITFGKQVVIMKNDIIVHNGHLIPLPTFFG